MRELMLIFHFIGLTMGLGTGFAHAFLGAASAKLSPDEAAKFRLTALAISTMGNIGIVLLLISGFYMITPFWKVLDTMPWLIVKLSLVLVLVVLIILINRAGKKAKMGDLEQFKKMKNMGKFTLLLGIAIVVAAVMAFR